MGDTDTEKAFSKFVDIIESLRAPKTGCPWDLQQDHRTLRPYLIEESYEVLQAIETQDDLALCDELGDVLLQVVLHAQLAKERKAFTIIDVINTVSEKMVRRHPHVFAETKVEDSDEVLRNWEQIKHAESESKKDPDQTSSSHPIADKLAAIPEAMPALHRAQRLGDKAARVNFDWDTFDGVLDKVKEEFSELEDELPRTAQGDSKLAAQTVKSSISSKQRSAIEHELGDLLFALCQLARWLGLSAEDCLRTCSARFLKRFHRMECSLSQSIEQLGLDQLEQAWQKSKESE